MLSLILNVWEYGLNKVIHLLCMAAKSVPIIPTSSVPPRSRAMGQITIIVFIAAKYKEHKSNHFTMFFAHSSVALSTLTKLCYCHCPPEFFVFLELNLYGREAATPLSTSPASM